MKLLHDGILVALRLLPLTDGWSMHGGQAQRLGGQVRSRVKGEKGIVSLV